MRGLKVINKQGNFGHHLKINSMACSLLTESQIWIEESL